MSEKKYNELDKSFKVLVGNKKCKTPDEVNNFIIESRMNKEVVVLGEKYTTIIADVAGFHRRHNSVPGSERPNKRFSIVRNNPFKF